MSKPMFSISGLILGFYIWQEGLPLSKLPPEVPGFRAEAFLSFKEGASHNWCWKGRLTPCFSALLRCVVWIEHG